VPYPTPAVAARARQLAAWHEHHCAVAEFRARRAADQQARLNALLLEAIAALATLLGTPSPPAQQHTLRPGQAMGPGREPIRCAPAQGRITQLAGGRCEVNLLC
jgi:hypothetical protein